jgi:hypothetical protein
MLCHDARLVNGLYVAYWYMGDLVSAMDKFPVINR